MDVCPQIRKPIFCIDITSDKENDSVNGSEFITCTASKQKVEDYETKQGKLDQTIQKSKLPFWFQIIKYLCLCLFLLVLASTIKVGLETALRNAPILVMGGFLDGILGITLHIVSKYKEKKVLEEENAEQQAKDVQEEFLSLQAEMGIPADAVPLDVLGFRYKMKNGEIHPYATAMQMTEYINLAVRIYATSEEIHVADLANVYSFPKSQLTAIRTVNKRIAVPTWNKEEDPTKGRFKPYKMWVNHKTGLISFKPYYILEIKKEDQVFGLYFP